ncbi:3-hydroxyacyl-CoA dehydrogenase [Janthinobacterium sp. 17J80-10]|uniref:3-hydroxyacyl-CoA dehydrogenase n=1 Tax=Janthinobacterium sp. 17J80-10 TaxID=2497863 RepID=UPI0010058762|nr:3-hydroxyacyl-CoA dehydrogenase [Janthinobacterium sp. 17J80-10]QAU32983.1 3-hydroxyacyl-CoA dehydrogenase [Janthinobacterium sp. 17J80-10]
MSAHFASGNEKTVAIVGAGSIGVAFALVFARAGWQVRLQDPDAARLAAVPAEVAERAAALKTFELVEESPQVLCDRVGTVTDLADAVAGVPLVLECAPERLDLKRALFAQLDNLARPNAILASVSSALPVSSFASDLPGRARCLIAHPGNPPYLIPVVEIVPADFTDAQVAQRAEDLFASLGMAPVRVAREVEGFIFNRLQGAVLREAYCLVRDGVASVADIDRVMREGLAPRWSVIGPFETVDLNTRGGIASHAEKMGPAYARMGKERGQDDPWTPELVAEVERQRRALLPLDQWKARVSWRDIELMALKRDRNKRAAKN